MPKMPSDLIIVRHGESEGNVALNASKKGDDSFFNIPGFRNRTGADWRLTKKGVVQAKAAGDRVRAEFPNGFDRYYVSDFARAKETAALLDIPGAVWFLNIYLHEQLWGRMDVVPRSEMEAKFPGAHAERNRHRFYGSYPDGESMAEVCLRLDRILETLGRECAGKKVILVCHGNVIWGFRMLIERITPYNYNLMDTSDYPEHQVHNGQIFHYQSRPHTNDAGELVCGGGFSHWRTIRPAGSSPVSEEWHPIVRPSFTNEELIAELDRIPRLIDN